MRDFDQWLAGFRESIAGYKYYVDFEKVYQNVDSIKVELNILNSLVGDPNIEEAFEQLVIKYPEILKCIPILLAKREKEILIADSEKGILKYQFDNLSYSIAQYKVFLKETGLFELLQKKILNNLVDYVTGVETGLDSNGRKNRGGHLMENLIESYLQKAGLIRNETYFKEMRISEIQKKWNIDLSAISNNGKAEKRFDFVIKGAKIVYGIETNFYATQGGSKLNETARSYKTIALESKDLKDFKFVWFTDGQGWLSAKNNLRETFDVLDHLYNINDLDSGIISKVLI